MYFNKGHRVRAQWNCFQWRQTDADRQVCLLAPVSFRLCKWFDLSLGDVINPDAKSTYFVMESHFNRQFWSKFEAGFLFIATKLIKMCPDYIKNTKILKLIDFNQNEIEIFQKLLKIQNKLTFFI